MEYPRTVVIESEKLKTLLQEKTDLVLTGREMSQQIEDCENDMAALDKEIQEYEAKVDLTDLKERMQQVTDAMNVVMSEMSDLKGQVHTRLRDGVPATFYEQYEAIEAKKKKLEEDRNKLALKVQKKNDKIIPIGRKLIAPHITDEFEDYDTLRLEGGQVIATIFSHMESFKEHYRKRKAT